MVCGSLPEAGYEAGYEAGSLTISGVLSKQASQSALGVLQVFCWSCQLVFQLAVQACCWLPALAVQVWALLWGGAVLHQPALRYESLGCWLGKSTARCHARRSARRPPLPVTVRPKCHMMTHPACPFVSTKSPSTRIVTAQQSILRSSIASLRPSAAITAVSSLPS
jgi:hypothetical protein